MKRQSISRIVAAITAIAMLPGCSADERRPSAVDAPAHARIAYAQHSNSVYINKTYADQIEGILQYGNDNATVVHTVLNDQMITADEINELERNAVSCFAQYGYQVNVDYWFAEDGGVNAGNATTMPPDSEQVRQASDDCEGDTGYGLLIYYYYKALYNPDNIDLEPYRFQCYQQHAVIRKEMTFEEYKQLMASGNSPIASASKAGGSTSRDYIICSRDPLHNISSPPTQ